MARKKNDDLRNLREVRKRKRVNNGTGWTKKVLMKLKEKEAQSV